MDQTLPQLSSYIRFFDLLSNLQEQNLITQKEKQTLKVALTLKDHSLMEILNLHMDGDEEEFKFSVLNYLKRGVPTDKHKRHSRRSRSSFTEISPFGSSTQIQQEDINEVNLRFNKGTSAKVNRLHTLTGSNYLVVREYRKSIQTLNSKFVSKQLQDNLMNLSQALSQMEIGRNSQDQGSNTKDILQSIVNSYKKIKSNFQKYMHSHLMIMDDIISYEQLFILLRQLVILLIGCDNFSFVTIKEEAEVFVSDSDNYLTLDKNLFGELNLYQDSNLYELESDSVKKILNAENKRSFLHQINNQNVFFIYHQSAEMAHQINHNYLSLVNQYGFFEEVNVLSSFLYQTIKRAKVQYFSPLLIADTIQEIGLAFLRCSKYLLIEQMLKLLKQNSINAELKINCQDTPKKHIVKLDFQDTQNLSIWFQNLKPQTKRDRELLLCVQSCYDKYVRFIKQCYDKRTFYKFFLRSNDSLIFEFDKRGSLVFLSRPIPKEFRDEFKISFNWSMIQEDLLRYNRVFEQNTGLVQQIETHIQDVGAKNVNDYMESQYEIFVKTEEQSFKGFVVIFQQRQDAWVKNHQKSLSSSTHGVLNKDLERRIRKQLLQQETMTYVQQLSESSDMSNSIALLYMPKKKSPSNRLIQPEQTNKIAIQNFNQATRIKKETLEKSTINSPRSIFSKYSFKLDIDQFELQAKDDILDTPDFNVLEINSKIEKHRVVWAILQKNNIIDEFNIPKDKLGEFLITLEKEYNQQGNPFHNYDHGIAVMQFAHLLNGKLNGQLDSFAAMTLLVSSLCHDVGHTGRTNLFEINSLSTLAIRYHDKNVLEQHHAAITIRILRDEKSSILQSFDKSDFKEFRKRLVQNILHTDMNHHFQLLKDFQASLNDQCELDLLSGILIHAADFNGTVRKFPVSQKWSSLVNQEFISQFEEEGKLGIPQQPYMKDLNKAHVMAKSEVGFMRVIVKPLYVALNEFYQGKLDFCLENIEETTKEWEKLTKE